MTGPATLDIADLGARIPDGAHLAIAPDYSGCAMAVIRTLLRRRIRGLRLVAVPTAGFQADMLIGAGCVAEIEAAAVSLGEYGPAGRFNAALRAGRIIMRDATCPAIHAGLQAAEKGIPFMPLRGIIGSDLVAQRPDWKLMDNPYAPQSRDPILLVPAITPEIALFHAPAADRNGNVFIGVRRELMLMAHAARRTLVSVERIVDTDFLADEARAGATIPALYVEAIAQAPRGSDPVGLFGAYGANEAALGAYAQASRDDGAFAAWLAGVDADVSQTVLA
ncbi:CoA transferase subunit A [Saliniramus sp.]|uniref:CoA transferase subunit A n=1 Tax=Saliniramus sp. TaxID=2986772 RepID=UPI002CF53B80|nr:CoA-transferase [Saliniramus sp.]HMB12162.1 CoA-transferase [Saliniramus sp.]